MNHRLTTLLIILLAAAAFSGTPPAAAQDEPPPILTIATKQIEPFVFYENGELAGFSIDLWHAIAREAGLDTEWLEVELVTDQLAAVEGGSADAAIAAISRTAERERSVDFSHSYFDAGLAILTVSRPGTVLGAFASVLISPRFLYAMGGLLILMVIIGNIVWFVERHQNSDHFPHTYFRGVWEGIWWAAVTATTVGYGDRTPVGFWGRLVGLLWMFSGLFVIANFTAAVTTQLTVDQLTANIDGTADLPGKRIATVAGSTSATWLHEHRLSFRGVETIDDAYALLAAGEIDAIVYDAPVLYYKIAHNHDTNFIIAGDIFNLETYGIALPTNSPYEDDINRALLTLFENGTYDDIHHRWFATTRYE